MDLLETQVSDLRYLSQPQPAAAAHRHPAASNNSTSTSPAGVATIANSPVGSASLGNNSAHSQHRHHQRNAGHPSLPLPVGLSSHSDYASVGGAGEEGIDDYEDGVGVGGKRKSIDEPTREKQTRSKRNRYISIACNECKRRKIKCNGQTPCQRCGNLNLACLYTPNCCASNFKDSAEFKQLTSQLARLQSQVDTLNHTVKSIPSTPSLSFHQNDQTFSNSVVAPSPSQHSGDTPTSAPRSLQQPRYPPAFAEQRNASFKGNTSMAFSLDVANSTIHNMGYRGLDQPNPAPQQLEDTATPATTLDPSAASQGDPLLRFDKDEMIRLCQLHEEEVGIMYPVLNIQDVIDHATQLAPYMNTLRSKQSPQLLNDEQTLRLKMVMCCALSVEEHGHSETAEQLYNSMEAVVNRKLMSDTSAVSNLPLFALLGGYRFLSNDEVLAWRVMGHVTRLCFELGMHQKRGLMQIDNDKDRKNALMSFWSAYVLDRRWAFGTGLPYVVFDDDVDPELPLPEEYPYLLAMITYSRVGAKVWRQVSHFGPILAQELREEEIERLDQEILQWYSTVPKEIQMRSSEKETLAVSTPSYNLQRLRIWTYLRLNQIRIWLYTPILHSATSIMSNHVQAQRVVDLAKDTIRYLSHLNNTTNLYRRIQVFYHQFLTSAISAVFLASVHAPVRFSAVCREEFYLGLDLVKDLSAKSWVSQRLWRTIRSLKDIAPRFGLDPDDDRHSNAALGMIGLARGSTQSSISTMTPPHPPPPPSSSTFLSHPQQHFSHPPHDQQQHHAVNTSVGSGRHGEEPLHNGLQIQSEMSKIFEGYVGLSGSQWAAAAADNQSQHQPHHQQHARGGLGRLAAARDEGSRRAMNNNHNDDEENDDENDMTPSDSGNRNHPAGGMGRNGSVTVGGGGGGGIHARDSMVYTQLREMF